MRHLILTLLLMLSLFLSNGYTQEYTTWGLPDGAKARLGKGAITAIEFSPDGSQIAVASPVGIWLYDAQTGKELALLPGHRDGFSTPVFSGFGGTLTINTLAFSPDGKLLASASEDGTLRLLDLTVYRERHTLLEDKEAIMEPLERIIALTFSADGKTLTSLDGTIRERRIKVWNVNSGRLLSDISGRKGGAPLTKDRQSRLTLKSPRDPRDVPLLAFTLSPDGTTFAATKLGVTVVNGVSNAVIRLGDVHTGDLHPVPMSANSVQSPIQKLVFSPDGTMLAGVETKTSVVKNPNKDDAHIRTTRSKVRIWSVEMGNELFTIIPQQVPSSALTPFVVFSPDGKMFASANQDVAAVQLWEVSTGNLISNLTISHKASAPPWSRLGAADLIFSPDSKTLAVATAGRDSSLQLWEVSTGKIILTLSDHSILTALPVNNKAFISLNPSGAQLRDIHTGAILQDLTEVWTNFIKSIGEIGEVKSWTFSPDNTTFAVGGKNGSLQLWSVGTGKQLLTLAGHTDNVNALAFTADGTRLASGSEDNSIKLWDARTGTLLLNFAEHVNFGKKLEYANRTLASAELVNNLMFSPDGRTLASASALGTIWLWDLNKGNLLTTLTAHEAGAHELAEVSLDKIGLAFSSDSTLLASGGMDGQVMVSGVSDNPIPLIFTGQHAWRVEALAFSPDGKRLVSGSKDNSIRLWDVETGVGHAVLSGHVGDVNALAFSTDGLTFISGSTDGTILLWDCKKIAQQTNK